MRGKPWWPGGIPRHPRIIPAHAGQTRSDYQNGDTQPDHPRACGANARRRDCRRAIYGSSPRMRGKPEHRHPGHGHRRIIPAHAGQTSPHAIMPPRSTDHPRACGANYNGTYSTFDDLGSSPRMRGKRQADRRGRGPDRIIPAHAGQTRIRQCSTRTDPDHPRACGANNDFLVQLGAMVGSSPRMRGKPMQTADKVDEHRIIPAHAGQTRPRPRTPVSPTDHPRACGANGSMTCAFRSCSGSSPRMRGKHDLRQQPRRKLRIIPAHAGQTDLPAGRAIESADHPRACGANDN